MDQKTEAIINSEIKIRHDYLGMLRKKYELPPGDCQTYSVDQLKNLISSDSTIKKIKLGMLNKETKHNRLVCSLRAGFLWNKLDNFMANRGEKRLDYNPENLPDLDFLTQLIEYVDKDNSMKLLKKKVMKKNFIKMLIFFIYYFLKRLQ